MNKYNLISSIRGFTLLELLVAVALMGLIALALYSSMYIGMKAKKSSLRALKPYHLILPVFESLDRDLKSTLEPSGVFAGSFKGENAAENNSDSMSFYCCNYHPKEDEKASGLVKIDYAVEKDDLHESGFVLERKITTNLLSSKTAETKDEVVCRGISSFNVQYYDGYNWVDSWDSTTQDNQLPQAVQVLVAIAEDNSGTNADSDTRTFTKTVYLSSAVQSQSEDTSVDQ